MESATRWVVAIAGIVAWSTADVVGGRDAWGAEEEKAVEAVEYRGRDYRNPFHGLLPTQPEPTAASLAPVELPALAITGIVWGAQRPLAIIDGQLVGVGDVVQEAEVVAIEQGAVRVRLQGREFLLKVP